MRAFCGTNILARHMGDPQTSSTYMEQFITCLASCAPIILPVMPPSTSIHTVQNKVHSPVVQSLPSPLTCLSTFNKTINTKFVEELTQASQ